MHRRILQEIHQLGSTYPVAAQAAREVVADLSKGVQVTFYLSKNYPFTAPEVRCNGHLYPSVFADPECKGECLCCASILCNARWEPIMTMTNIMQEIEQNIAKRAQMRRAALERRLARQIVQTHLFAHCPVDTYF